MSAVRTAAVALLGLAALGCGYRVLGAPEGLGPDIEIGMLENRSNSPGVERMLSDALHEEFVRRGQLEPRYADGSASLVLNGVVREVSVRHSAVSTVGLALEDQLELVVDVSIRRRADGSVVWRRDGWTQQERYTSSADVQVQRTNREQALRRLSAELASRLHDELVTSF
jgi:hypothetical protein